MMLGKSKSDKIVTTLDAGLQRRLEELAQNWKKCHRATGMIVHTVCRASDAR